MLEKALLVFLNASNGLVNVIFDVVDAQGLTDGCSYEAEWPLSFGPGLRRTRHREAVTVGGLEATSPWDLAVDVQSLNLDEL